ncbi:hypothetical protein EVAR_78121_1 [Eumeta japonica]|uniref:Uncharacterized protein n=1 Tax=Eumeta variegata TaxID=151549 RepID=A0A4C1T1C1_EUMVA|nr:hypothetical protein EVAR_78121_1 [Eumeta japonica]
MIGRTEGWMHCIKDTARRGEKGKGYGKRQSVPQRMQEKHLLNKSQSMEGQWWMHRRATSGGGQCGIAFRGGIPDEINAIGTMLNVLLPDDDPSNDTQYTIEKTRYRL